MVRVHTRKPEHSPICPGIARMRLSAEGTLPALRPKDRLPPWHPRRPETAPSSCHRDPEINGARSLPPRGPRAPSLGEGTHTAVRGFGHLWAVCPSAGDRVSPPICEMGTMEEPTLCDSFGVKWDLVVAGAARAAGMKVRPVGRGLSPVL